MPRNMSITFLGTSSGGGPSESRNCSSLVADVVGDGSLWMIDCGEGTLRQFSLQPRGQRYLKTSKLTKIFITHMHADHIMGIVTILRQILYPPFPSGDSGPSIKASSVEIYGPAGLRNFIRSVLKMTFSRTADRYAVHELLTSEDALTPCTPSEILHSSENVGQDILCDEHGFWKEFTGSIRGDILVDAGPIEHRDPCIGYIIREPSYPKRKLVILGDTSDPSSIIPLATTPTLLIHEATDAYIPRSIDPQAKRAPETVKEKALSRGHSTPDMAGAFAKTIRAEKLVLNHIGGRFPAPYKYSRNSSDTRATVLQEIERQASQAWGMGKAQAAIDFMWVDLPHPGPPQEMSENSQVEFPHKQFVSYGNRRYQGAGSEREVRGDKKRKGPG